MGSRLRSQRETNDRTNREAGACRRGLSITCLARAGAVVPVEAVRTRQWQQLSLTSGQAFVRLFCGPRPLNLTRCVVAPI